MGEQGRGKALSKEGREEGPFLPHSSCYHEFASD